MTRRGAKRRAIARDADFERLHNESVALFNEHRDCTVKALAIAGQIPYAQAHAILKARGRKNKTGLFFYEQIISEELTKLGFKVERVRSGYFIERFPGVHKNIQSVTTYHPIRFPAAFSDGHTYIFVTRGHVAAIVNGVTKDWSNNRPLRATSILRITR